MQEAPNNELLAFTKDLSWDSHITKIVKKANKNLGFLRTLRVGPKSVKEKTYLALVRPTHKYASPVWDPYTATNITKIEAVQRRAARWGIKRHRQTSSVDR